MSPGAPSGRYGRAMHCKCAPQMPRIDFCLQSLSCIPKLSSSGPIFGTAPTAVPALAASHCCPPQQPHTPSKRPTHHCCVPPSMSTAILQARNHGRSRPRCHPQPDCQVRALHKNSGLEMTSFRQLAVHFPCSFPHPMIESAHKSFSFPRSQIHLRRRFRGWRRLEDVQPLRPQ